MTESNIINYVPWTIIIFGGFLWLAVQRYQASKKHDERDKQHITIEKESKSIPPSATHDVKDFTPVVTETVSQVISSPITKTVFGKDDLIKRIHEEHKQLLKKDIELVAESASVIIKEFLEEIELRLITGNLKAGKHDSIDISLIAHGLHIPSHRIDRETCACFLYKHLYEELRYSGWRTITVNAFDGPEYGGNAGNLTVLLFISTAETLGQRFTVRYIDRQGLSTTYQYDEKSFTKV